MSKDVAIVGAGGFLGRALTRYFACRDVRVHGYTSGSATGGEATSLTRFDAAHNDIRFSEGTSAVFYLSQSSSYREFPRRADHLLAVNVLGAVKAARAAIDAGATFFFYASTGNVYRPSFQPMNEDHPIRRDNGYSLSKVMAEETLPLVAPPMQLIVGRIFGLFGPGQTGMLVPNLCQRIRTGQPVQVAPSDQNPGDEEGLRVSLCYVEDACHCLFDLWRLHGKGVDVPQTVNIAGPEPISIRRLASDCGQILGRPPMIERSGGTRPFDLISDNTRLERLVSPRYTSFRTALEKTLGNDSAESDGQRPRSKVA